MRAAKEIALISVFTALLIDGRLLGIRFKKELNVKKLVILVITAVLMTVLFTALDDVITPLYYGFSLDAMKSYAIASLTPL